MADYKETQVAWARRRCIEQDQNGQEGRWVMKLEHIRGEIKGAFCLPLLICERRIRDKRRRGQEL